MYDKTVAVGSSTTWITESYHENSGVWYKGVIFRAYRNYSEVKLLYSELQCPVATMQLVGNRFPAVSLSRWTICRCPLPTADVAAF